MEQTYNLFIEEYLAATIHTSWKIKELIIDLINTYNLIPEDTSTIKTLIINNLRKKSTDINISRVARNTANEILARRLRRSIIQQRNIDNEVQNQESTLDLISDSPPLDTSTDQPTPLEQQSSTEPPSIKIPYKESTLDLTSDPPSLDTPTDQLTPLEHQLKYHIRYTTMTLRTVVLRAHAESVEVIIENSTNVTIKGQLPFGNDYGNLIEANWPTDFELNIIFPSEINVNDDATVKLEDDSSILAINKKGKKKLNIP
ncbi:12602_t:CDS:2, partial [Gigaspora rosea]